MSKTLIVLIVGITGLLSVGCAFTPTMKYVAGTYVWTKDGVTAKLVFLDNGAVELYARGKKREEGKWKIVDGEIHVGKENESVVVIRVNKDGSITFIAEIEDGKRTDTPKDEQFTLKKISSSTIKRLVRPHTNDTDTSPTMKSVAGTYEHKELASKTVRAVFLDNGVVELYDRGKKTDKDKWKIVDGDIHVGKENEGDVVIRVNKDGSLTVIAEIEDGKRTALPKDEQRTFKKIK